MEAIAHRRRNIASGLIAFFGIIALAVAGVATFAGAGQEGGEGQCAAGTVKFDWVDLPFEHVDVNGTFNATAGSQEFNGEPKDVVNWTSSVPGLVDTIFVHPGDTGFYKLYEYGPTDSSGTLVAFNANNVADFSHACVLFDVPQVEGDDDDDIVEGDDDDVVEGDDDVEVGVEEEQETTTTTAAVAGIVVEPEAPEAAPEELAFTGIGNSTALFAALGVVLISFGIGLAWAGRREVAWVHDER